MQSTTSSIHDGYLAFAVGVGGESIGLPLPGETMLVIAATYAATTHRLSPTVVVTVAALAANVGDKIGFSIGCQFGSCLLPALERRLGRRSRHLNKARRLFDRHWSQVVVVGRFVSVVRTYTAVIAETSRMPWSRFATHNALASTAWAAAFGFGAATLGSSAGPTFTYIAAGIGLAAATIGQAAPTQPEQCR